MIIQRYAALISLRFQIPNRLSNPQSVTPLKSTPKYRIIFLHATLQLNRKQ